MNYWHVFQRTNRYNAWQGWAVNPQDAFSRACLFGHLGRLGMNDVVIIRIKPPKESFQKT